MRPKDALAWGAVALLAAEVAVAAGLAVVGAARQQALADGRADNRRLAAELGLSDLALWSDASYCRHPTLSGFFDAHADHPSALEHFPAGSWVPPSFAPDLGASESVGDLAP